MNITDDLKNDFLIYAKEVNENRAFPAAVDGLKPSQRAGLYTLYNHGFTSNKPHVKSAKVTGAVIGELWPHGDSSAYDTLVRMSQPWINNICEVDFHGANGSVMGGPQAAHSRYTECRLSAAAEDGLFENIKKDTVDFILNFSEDMEWPEVLPAIMPRLFINGGSGIGYTIANDWQPGNLKEFIIKLKSFIKTGSITCNDIYPDYPSGGVIINKSDIHNIYETGRGKVILRAKTNIAGNIIQITELPYQIYAEPIISEIKELVINDKITGIDDVLNKSGDSGLLIEVICTEDPDIILKKLFKLTDLQVSFDANQMALVNGMPTLLTLKDYIKVYLDHNLSCINREYNYTLKKSKERFEIIEGLITAINNLDSIISIIRNSKNSDSAKSELIENFKFTDAQAAAIIEMKLRRLAGLEFQELQDEKIELNKIITECQNILNSNKLQQDLVISRLEKFEKKYGYSRHTEVTDVQLEVEAQVIKQGSKKSDEEFVIILNSDNSIKRIKISEYRSRKNRNEKSNIREFSKNKFILISNQGRLFKLQVGKIGLGSEKSSGIPVSNYLDLNNSEKIVNIFNENSEENYLFFLTRSGLVKRADAAEYLNISKSIGAPVMKVDSSDEIINVDLFNEGGYKIITSKNKIINLNVNNFISKGRTAGGVNGCKLKPGVVINSVKKFE